MLELQNIHIAVDGKEIVKGISLTLEKGKVHALMGPNGSGKSTLANALMGHPSYEITQGKILLNGEDITALEADERARKGLFLSFQYPSAVPGITIANLLRTALNARRKEKIPPLEFLKLLKEKMKALKMDDKFLTRYVNDGFSGGEKKRAEILQLSVLDPKVAILDETDSGLDIDALRIVSDGVNQFMSPEKTVLIITHYKRILEHVKPDKIFILVDGKIAKEGSGELVDRLEEEGYAWIQEDA